MNEEIRIHVKRELGQNSILRDQNILVDSEEDALVLQGDVDSHYKKWLAQNIALDTKGVMKVRNEIYIAREDFYEN